MNLEGVKTVLFNEILRVKNCFLMKSMGYDRIRILGAIAIF